MSKQDQVREYVTKVLRENKDDRDPVNDDGSLVTSGRLSSLDVVDVLTYLETQFNYSMDPNEFDLEKFDSVNKIVALLENPSR
jgi:methoxymalonate biosynthesis acyl carrier protein